MHLHELAPFTVTLLLVSCGGSSSDSTLDHNEASSEADAGTREDSGGTERISYKRDVQPIWDRNCIACHSRTSERQLDLQLDAERSYEALLETTSVMCFWVDGEDVRAMSMMEPGVPEKSAILAIMGSPQAHAQCQTVMPRGTAGLREIAPEQWEVVRRWIAEGATRE